MSTMMPRDDDAMPRQDTMWVGATGAAGWRLRGREASSKSAAEIREVTPRLRYYDALNYSLLMILKRRRIYQY